LIPLCHPLPLAGVEVVIEESGGALRVAARVRTSAPTGVEMEALTAVQVGLLTLYDMLKSADRAMTIGPVRLLEKRGGRSGLWRHPEAALQAALAEEAPAEEVPATASTHG
jgi:cyclic pyranopterin phosphate synthase